MAEKKNASGKKTTVSKSSKTAQKSTQVKKSETKKTVKIMQSNTISHIIFYTSVINICSTNICSAKNQKN